MDELERLRAVVEVQRAIASRLDDPEAVMAVVAGRSMALTAADGAVVELVEGGEMVYRCVTGAAEGSLGLRLDASASLSGLCVAQGEPLRCDDTETDDRVDRAATRRIGIRSMLCVPLFPHEGGAVGVLKVIAAEPHRFGDDAVATLAALAEFIATSLRYASTFEEHERRATHDALTGLANRRLLLDRLALALARRTRSSDPVALLFVDLNGFKAVNDGLGHEVGDRVLRAAGVAMARCVRPEDTVARLGGDEFVVLCEGLSDEQVAKVAERLAASVAAASVEAPAVTASVGVARARKKDTAESLLARADEAMYAVKRGRATP